jgi:NAD(P)H dehydrogenase (quinone)
MKVFIVHAHPEAQSFNGSLTRTAVEALTAAGHSVQVSDLYAMQFNPVSDRRNFTTVKDSELYRQQQEELYATENNGFALDIQTELDKLEWCDTLIFQFPLWWFGLPAILKGWVDKVLAMGKTYGMGRFYDHGVFQGKRAMCSLTTGGPGTMYSEYGLNGDINMILFPINHGIFRFVGFDPLPPVVIYSPVRLSPEVRQAELQRYRETVLRLAEIEPIKYPSLSEYDQNMVLKSANKNV